MIYTFVYDIHRGADNEMSVDFDLSNRRLVLGGDVFDLANCKKSQVGKIQKEINRHKSILGTRYVTGNHERQHDMDRLFVIPGTKTGVMHGDHIFWGSERAIDYRQKDHGAGFFKRKVWVNALEALENGYDRKVKTDDLERFAEICELHDLNRIIVGHMHPAIQLDIHYKGFHLTVCKRGVTNLDII
jgi:hypothetical protein